MSKTQIKQYWKGKTKMKTKIFSLVLIVALVGLYSGTAYSQKAMPKKGFFKGQLFDKLKLTDQQKSKMEELRISHQKEMVDLKANLEKKLLSLKELRLKENIDRNSVLAAVNDINQARNKIAVARANNLMDMYELLTPDQQKTLKENIGMMLDNFGPEGRGFGMHGKGFRMHDEERGGMGNGPHDEENPHPGFNYFN
jgi:Spy/CpxP family protein refolding chaperone